MVPLKLTTPNYCKKLIYIWVVDTYIYVVGLYPCMYPVISTHLYGGPLRAWRVPGRPANGGPGHVGIVVQRGVVMTHEMFEHDTCRKRKGGQAVLGKKHAWGRGFLNMDVYGME